MKPVFKEYIQGQTVLFPESIDDYIPKNHVVRLISEIVDKLDISSITKTYKGGGTSSYHPRMLLKILFYAYLTNIFSSRKIEKALKENIYFMWLSGKQFPDFRTINNFRSRHLKGQIQKIFSEIVMMLAQMGVVDIKKIAYTDGTKIEANANRYTFVWRGTINYHRTKLEEKLKKILKEIDAQIKEDSNQENEEIFDNKKISKDVIEKKLKELNNKLQTSNLPEKQKQKIEKKLEKIEQEELPRFDKYEASLETMGTSRNSYSKTDPDATFMRMKEDHMKNGQLKPAYNVQISTQEQIITNYSIHQNRTDTGTYIEHLQQYNQLYKNYPSMAVADAGYGSQENYEFLDNYDIETYVKYNWFYKSEKKKYKKDISKVNNLYYNELEDYFVCPIGQKMQRIGSYQKTTDNGFSQEIVIYQAINCVGCPMRGACHKSKYNRKIYVNHKLRKLKEKAKSNLVSEIGKKYSKKRSTEPESVFGQIKQNKGFRRFMLRGIDKVNIEFGLIAIVHNIQKLWKWLLNRKNKGINSSLPFNFRIFILFLQIISISKLSYSKKHFFAI